MLGALVANVTMMHVAKETYPVVQSMIDLNEYECANKTMNSIAFIPGHVAPLMLDLLHSHTLVNMKIQAEIVHSCLIVQLAIAPKRLLIRRTTHYDQVMNGVGDCS